MPPRLFHVPMRFKPLDDGALVSLARRRAVRDSPPGPQAVCQCWRCGVRTSGRGTLTKGGASPGSARLPIVAAMMSRTCDLHCEVTKRVEIRGAIRHSVTRVSVCCSLHAVRGRDCATSSCVQRSGERQASPTSRTSTSIDENERCDHSEERGVDAHEEAEKPIRLAVDQQERFLAVATTESRPEPRRARAMRLDDASSYVEALAVRASPGHRVSLHNALLPTDQQSSCAPDTVPGLLRRPHAVRLAAVPSCRPSPGKAKTVKSRVSRRTPKNRRRSGEPTKSDPSQ